MKNKDIKLSKNFEEFYPQKYTNNSNSKQGNKKEMKKNSNSVKKTVTFNEYIPKNKIQNQQKHPLEKNKECYFPKNISKFSKEKPSKKEEFEFEDEEDDYSGLAGGNYYQSNYREVKWKNKKRSEDTNNFKTKWKTEICHYWEMYGYCKFGDSCAFAHGTDELNKRKMSNNYKTKPCKQFFELGYCSYGIRCQFSHKLLKEFDDKNEVSYLKILSDFNNSSNQISHEIIKRPRLMTFENITSCTLDEKEKNRLELYKDILDMKKKGSEERENIFSIDTNDENSEINSKIENTDKKDINNNEEEKIDNDNDNEKNKRERFISI